MTVAWVNGNADADAQQPRKEPDSLRAANRNCEGRLFFKVSGQLERVSGGRASPRNI